MILTIHGVERIQERTALRLSQCNEIFALDAYVHLGKVVDGFEYLLFYDYVGKFYRVACVRESHLVSIWKTDFNLPKEISDRITYKNKLEAKRLVYGAVLGRTLQESVVRYILLSICPNTDDEVEELLKPVNILTFEATGTNAKRQDVLTICFSEVIRYCAILKAQIEAVQGKITVWLKILDEFENVNQAYKYDAREIVNVIAAENGSIEIDATLLVEDASDTFSHYLGNIPLAQCETFDEIASFFAETFSRVYMALATVKTSTELGSVRYSFILREVGTGIRYGRRRKRHVRVELPT